MSQSCYSLSADIGGTFTDFVAIEETSGLAFTGKVLSTPANQAIAVLEGIRQLIPDPSEIGFIVHGTTVGLNAFLERKGARVLLITTAGVSDYYTIARGDRTDLYKLQYHKPQRLVPRHDVHEVRERIKWDGTVIEPLHLEDFQPIIEKIKRENIQAVAICFLHAYAYPQHELQAREILMKALPEISVTLSHEVAREWREYERASTAIMNAYIAPGIERYLSSLEREMKGLGVTSTLYVMQSSGGIMTAESARKQPIRTLLSGPVGGTIGGVVLSKWINRPNLLCVDMGGTSFDMSLVINHQPNVSTVTSLEGLPLLTPIVDIHTIGAGGGSLAWIEAGGLRVGPQSAGADPGPACYGRGGNQPTVTDAHLSLNRIGTNSLLSGRMTLDGEAASRVIHDLANKMGLDDVALAEGILSIINAKMADGIRTITIAQGIDPRDFSLLAFGGAGPMHAVWLAEELGIRETIIPFSPGTFSASGMLQTDIRHDFSHSYYRLLTKVDPQDMANVYARLIEEGREALKEESVPPEDMHFELSSDMRYQGQEYSINVRIGKDFKLSEIEKAFHEAYRVRYGHATPGAPVEFVTLRVAAFGLTKRKFIGYRTSTDRHDPLIDTRRVIFDGCAYSTPILRREWIPLGSVYAGPVVIEEDSATTIVPPGYESMIDQFGNIIIVRKEAK
ncbi:MAG: N-methylhydantoinase A [Anaerolineae bacterium]|jgi:N-methylhydantoinase A|nr:MAG: N-methylhydantoinase A [Anaerolineae bacterium]